MTDLVQTGQAMSKLPSWIDERLGKMRCCKDYKPSECMQLLMHKCRVTCTCPGDLLIGLNVPDAGLCMALFT